KRSNIALALEKVGLKGYEKKRIYTISGGEQQRVSIARLLLKPSSIILADEPTGSLDSENRDEILAILHDMCKVGKTLIIVTHDPIVAKSCDRIVKL
ncbi:MAG: ATP-binding cassette domain-containing protein, partial [Erysipelotrichaceae bacterium]